MGGVCPAIDTKYGTGWETLIFLWTDALFG